MDDYETNYIVLRTILDSCLSNINKLKPLWHYGILLTEIEEDFSISYLFNLSNCRIEKNARIMWNYCH